MIFLLILHVCEVCPKRQARKTKRHIVYKNDFCAKKYFTVLYDNICIDPSKSCFIMFENICTFNCKCDQNDFKHLFIIKTGIFKKCKIDLKKSRSA